jgi:predicted AAA+ superfamily ATPase
MQREAMKALAEWKMAIGHKPLIIKGARQVGKTWIMKEFGRQYFKQTAYINFDSNEHYRPC